MNFPAFIVVCVAVGMVGMMATAIIFSVKYERAHPRPKTIIVDGVRWQDEGQSEKKTFDNRQFFRIIEKDAQ